MSPVHNQFLQDANNQPSPAGLREAGPIISIEVRIPQQIAQVLTTQGQPVPAPAAGIALIDTGASVTCIHEPILQGLNLNPIGIAPTGTAGGQVQRNVYPATIVFLPQGWTADFNRVIGVDLSGQIVQTHPPQPIIALIGRNVLERFVFIYNGPGGFWTLAT